MSDAAIWQEIGALKARLEALEKRPAGQASNGGGSAGGASVASDYDLDSDYGNPVIKKDPRDWPGPSFAGCRMSECSPDYLDRIASLYDWMANKDDERGAKGEAYTNKKGETKPVDGGLRRKDASRARGWAARARNGQAAPAPAQRSTLANTGPAPAPQDDYGSGSFDDSEIPF